VSEDSVERAPVSGVLCQRETKPARCGAVEAQNDGLYITRAVQGSGRDSPLHSFTHAIMHACPVESLSAARRLRVRRSGADMRAKSYMFTKAKRRFRVKGLPAQSHLLAFRAALTSRLRYRHFYSRAFFRLVAGIFSTSPESTTQKRTTARHLPGGDFGRTQV
jgi:hypothetical protein